MWKIVCNFAVWCVSSLCCWWDSFAIEISGKVGTVLPFYHWFFNFACSWRRHHCGAEPDIFEVCSRVCGWLIDSSIKIFLINALWFKFDVVMVVWAFLYWIPLWLLRNLKLVCVWIVLYKIKIPCVYNWLCYIWQFWKETLHSFSKWLLDMFSFSYESQKLWYWWSNLLAFSYIYYVYKWSMNFLFNFYFTVSACHFE